MKGSFCLVAALKVVNLHNLPILMVSMQLGLKILWHLSWTMHSALFEGYQWHKRVFERGQLQV